MWCYWVPVLDGEAVREGLGLSWWLAALQFFLRRATVKNKQLAAATANAKVGVGPSALESAGSVCTAWPCA